MRYSGGREVYTSYATTHADCNLFTNHGTNLFEFIQNGIKFQGSTCDEAKKKANLQSPVKEVFGGTSTPDLIVNSIKNIVAPPPPPQKKPQQQSLPSRFEGIKIPTIEEVFGGTSTPDLQVHSEEVFGGTSTPDLITSTIKSITKPIQDLVSNVTGGGGASNAISSFGLPPTIFNIQTPIVLGAVGAILLVILLIRR